MPRIAAEAVAGSQLGGTAVTGDERAALRYAVASEPGIHGPGFIRDAAYAGPHLLVVAHGIQHLSSPGSPGKITINELRRLDVPADPADLAVSAESGLAGLRETFGRLLEGDPGWNGTGVVLTAMLWQDTHAVIAHVGNTRQRWETATSCQRSVFTRSSPPRPCGTASAVRREIRRPRWTALAGRAGDQRHLPCGDRRGERRGGIVVHHHGRDAGQGELLHDPQADAGQPAHDHVTLPVRLRSFHAGNHAQP
jgi:hypothetical protein